jgi:hypothetical protein
MSIACNFILINKLLELRDKPKEVETIITDEEMLEEAKKLGNNANLNNINQAALNIWYNWVLRQIKLLKSKEIEFNIID